MARVADTDELLSHVNLARVYRGGERQTELLILGLTKYLSRQRLITRRGMPLHTRLRDIEGVEVVPVDGRLGAIAAAGGSTLLHAHETRGAQVSCLRHAFTGTPYVITRRVDNRPRSDPFTRYMYRSAARVVVLSEAIRRIVSELEPGAKTRRIPSVASGFTSDEAWVRRYRESLPGKFLVGQIAALDHSHKGQLTLIDAARRVQSTFPELHFIIAGSGRDEQRIRDAAADLENISFTGWVDNIGDYLAAFDIFVLPSLREGLGSVLLDAMQFGLPVVASEVGGIPDIVTNGETGLLTPPGDGAELAEAIVGLYQNAGMRNAMAQAAKERARDFRPEQMIDRYWQLYREILPSLGQES